MNVQLNIVSPFPTVPEVGVGPSSIIPCFAINRQSVIVAATSNVEPVVGPLITKLQLPVKIDFVIVAFIDVVPLETSRNVPVLLTGLLVGLSKTHLSTVINEAFVKFA
jgi:hypothetical protein